MLIVAVIIVVAGIACRKKGKSNDRVWPAECMAEGDGGKGGGGGGYKNSEGWRGEKGCVRGGGGECLRRGDEDRRRGQERGPVGAVSLGGRGGGEVVPNRKKACRRDRAG